MKNKSLKIILAIGVVAVLTSAVFALQAATRIRFAKGKSSATVSGTVGKYGKKEYVLRGSKGQTLTASVESECESVTIDVIDKGTGQTLNENPTTEYQDELPGTDDYVIRVQNSDLPACKFTLKVGIE
jgi:hypothetical protein